MRKIHLVIIACLLAFLLAAGAGFLWIWKHDPYIVQLELIGQRELTLEYGTAYTEPGAAAKAEKMFFRLGQVEVPVTLEGSVNTHALGSYEIVYTASIEDDRAVQTRRIQVVDTTPPAIELVGGENYSILPGTIYEEPGFTAIDACDGDLTSQVEVIRYGDILTYTVSDSSGNTASIHRTVVVQDLEAPQITLLGETYMELSAGGYYRELGCTATDNRDGEITHRVEVTGDLDVFTPGTYSIVYSVSDLFGNRTEAARTICVQPVEGITVAPYSGKNVYLTFDDGPGKYTQTLLDTLAKYDIPVTFFVTDTGYGELLTRMAQNGHTVAMHSASHKYTEVYDSEEAYFADLGQIQSIIEEYTGQKPMLLRFPGGSSNTVSRFNKGIMTRLTGMLTEHGYTYFDWNVDSNDAGGAKTAQQVFDNVTAGIAKNQDSVVLQHDVKEYSVEAVEDIILWGLENGCRFLPLTADSPTFHHDLNN